MTLRLEVAKNYTLRCINRAASFGACPKKLKINLDKPTLSVAEM